MLDKYLETLTKEASTKEKKQEAFGAASVEELSKLAGVKLAEDICTNCASKMTKLGSIYQCACGMMKKAMSKCSKCGSTMEKTSTGEKCSSCGVKHAAVRGAMAGAGKGVGMPGGLRRNIQKGPCPEEGPGEGKGGGRGKGLPRALAANVSKVKAVQDPKKPGAEVPAELKKSAADMPPFLSQDRPKKVKEIYSALKRDNPDMPAEMKARIAARQGKKGKQKQGPPYKGPLTKGAAVNVGMEEGDPLKELFLPTTGALVGGVPGVLGARSLGRRIGQSGLMARRPGLALTLAGLGGAVAGGGGSLAGAGVGELGRRALKRRRLMQEQDKTAATILEEAGLDKIAAAQLSFLAAQEDYNLEKIAARLENMGMDKEAIGGLLKAIGTAGKGLFQAAKGVGKAGPRIGVGQAARTGAQQVGTAAKAYGKGVGQTFQAARRAGGGSIGRGLLGVAKARPELAVAGGAIPAFAAGRMTKSSSALSNPEIIKVGETAGRMLAKVAQGIPMEELQESMEEAKTREDIPGRAKRWQVGGGVAGGLAGAAPGALLAALSKRRLLGAGLGLAGGAGGAYLGQRMGKAHGAEEASADRAISLLRAMRAHRIGARTGYGTGLRRGYMAGRGTGE